MKSRINATFKKVLTSSHTDDSSLVVARYNLHCQNSENFVSIQISQNSEFILRILWRCKW